MNNTGLPTETVNISGTGTGDGGPIHAVVGMLSFFSVIGTTGNALVLYVYTRKRNKLAATVFIISLATTDLTTSVVVMPYTIVIEYLNYYVKYDIFCKMYMFFITSNVPFAAFIMVGIALDRYFCIVHPFKHLMNALRAKIITASMAVLAFTLGIITALNYSVYEGCGGVNDTCEVKFTGVCKTSEILLPHTFTLYYQRLYTALFFLALVVVMVLYALIYRSVLIRRAKRRRQRRSMCSYNSSKESWFQEYRFSMVSSLRKHSEEKNEKSNSAVESELLRQLAIRERGLVANIKTALMLFVVTAVFILVFLPAWLMAHQIIDYNRVIFYMYFAYNVANPIIYAFMNKAFRRQLKIVFKCD